MTAAELRAITAQGPAVVMVSREDMLALLDNLDEWRAMARKLTDDADAWQRCAATMATAAMRGDAVSAFTIWTEHVAKQVKQAVEEGK